MTYRELYEKAERKLEKGEITSGEFDEMTKPLDEEIRPHGEWIDVNGDGSIVKCSVCGDMVCCKNNNFCPNCGADMRVKSEIEKLKSEIEKLKSEIENSNLPERFTATDCSCLNCKNRHSVHCEPQNKKIYGYCGNWERR